MHWRVKGVVQRGLSAMPMGVRINDWLQLSVGDLRNFENNVEGRVVRDWLVLMDNMGELSIDPHGRHFFEIGTGWMPVLPICFSLSGAASCTTVDLTRHMNHRLTFRMLGLLKNYLPRIAAASKRSVDQVESDYERLARAPSLDALLDVARIRYLSPADARATGLQAESVDVVFSNNVFEHVPYETLRAIFVESHRLLRKGGLAIHAVNCADHYAYFDRNITFANYFAFSERQWRFWNSNLQYQNRLRPTDFVNLTREAGLEVRLRKVRTRPELRAAVDKMKLAPEFLHYDRDELCSTSVLVGGIRPGAVMN